MASVDQHEEYQSSMKRLSKNNDEATPKTKRPKRTLFQTRCNPKLNYKLISTLKVHDKFRHILCLLGLDCFLDLRVTRLQRELCAQLARKIDVQKSLLSVHGKHIPLTYASVTKIMGLQCTGMYKDFSVSVTKDEQLQICDKFNLDPSARISQYTLWSYLEDAQAFDEEFKAKFILFTIATMRRPTTNVHIHFREYLPMLAKMDTLCEFNWAKFVLDGLLDAVTAFQKRGAQSLGGCLLYLQLMYIQCISPVHWTHCDESLLQTPCLKNWTDDRITVMAKLMQEQGGIQSNKVMVRARAIDPFNATADYLVQPQLLMLEVLLARLMRRVGDTENDIREMLTQFSQQLAHLCMRVAHLEDRKESTT